MDGNLIKTKKSVLNENNQLSTLRFYTSQPTDFVALGFNSLQTHLIQDLDNESIDELLNEIEERDLEDDVYTEEDVE